MTWSVAVLALALAVKPVPYPSIPSEGGAGDGGGVSPVASLHVWDKGGSADWGAGIPSPTIDCAAVGTSSAASMQCSGATPSFAGSAQTAAGSPWWYRGDTAVRPSIALNGSTDYWDLGDVGGPAGSFTVVCEYRPDASSLKFIFAKDSSGSGPWYLADEFAGAPFFRVFKSGGGSSYISGPAWTLGAWYVTAAAYEYVTDGTSRLRMAVNGVLSTEVTTAVGPPANTANSLRIGARGVGNPFSGPIRRCAFIDGWAASNAQLQQITATQQGLAADRPAGTYSPVARTDSTLCCPFSDAECFTVGPGGPCIHAPSYSGWAGTGPGIEVYGAGANALSQSDIGAWALGSGGGSSDPVRTSNAAAAPDGTMTADKLEFPAVSAGWSLAYLTFTATAATWTEAVWARTDSGTATVYLSATPNGSTYVSAACNVGPTWSRCWGSGTLTAATWYAQIGVDMRDATQTAKPAQTVYLWQGQATPTAYPVPLRTTTGTAYAGNASTATTLTGTSALLSKDRWALGITATPTGGWATPSLGLLQWGGAYGTANSVSVYTDAAAKLVVEIYDGASGWRRWTADAALTGTTPVQRKIGVAYNTGTIRVLVDGAEVTGTMSGAGTGLLAALPSTSLVSGTVGSSILRGLDARVCQANDLAGLKRCLR